MHMWSALANRFHDPCTARASFELLYKEMILAGQCKGAGEKVTFGCLEAAKFSFKIFPMSFQVFHHEVFASQL